MMRDYKDNVMSGKKPQNSAALWYHRGKSSARFTLIKRKSDLLWQLSPLAVAKFRDSN